jgi:uncharacterized iron-regulated membrane protein
MDLLRSRGPLVDLYLLFSLLCPVSMVALVAWWAWSVRRPRSSSGPAAPVRQPADAAALEAMRAQMSGQRRTPAPPRR